MKLSEAIVIAVLYAGIHSAIIYAETYSEGFRSTIAEQDVTISELAEQLEKSMQYSMELYDENKKLSDEIVLRQDITSLVVDAARSYKLDPKLLAVLIKSEGGFRPNPKHATPDIVGPLGVHTKMHKTLHNPNTYTGNIYAGAEILSKYIDTSDSLTLAITRYKGFNQQGYQQAKAVVKEYNELNKE